MTDVTSRVVRDWLAAVNAGLADDALALTAADVVIVGPRGVAHGHEILRAWLGHAGATFETLRTYALGDAVVVAQRGVWRDPATRVVVGEADVATRFRVRDGRVAEIERYDGDGALADALRAAGLTEGDTLSGPRMRPFAPLGLGAVLLAGLVACAGDVLHPPVPARFAGRYALVTVNGRPAPAVVSAGSGQTYTLLADTLTFGRDGTVIRHWRYRHQSVDMTPADTVYAYRDTLPYTVIGTQLTIGERVSCPPNANCVGVETGTITATAVTTRESLYWSGAPVLRFRRLPTP